MPTATIDGIRTSYEVHGSGAPLLMFSPGGFDAAMAKWRTLQIYRDTKVLDHLAGRFACVVFDRRESGDSGGRVEPVTWSSYVVQAKGLLDHLGYERAHVMGGCMGCSPALAFAVAHPAAVQGLVLFWPAGGPRYRIRGRGRFGEHLAYMRDHGLDEVVSLARSHEKGFGEDPRVGPWASVIRRDPAFAERYRAFDPDRYEAIVSEMARSLLDRDTVPGAEPEELLALEVPALIVPGQDASHATSAARYLEECLEAAQYWDEPVSEQTEFTVPARIVEFLDAVA